MKSTQTMLSNESLSPISPSHRYDLDHLYNYLFTFSLTFKYSHNIPQKRNRLSTSFQEPPNFKIRRKIASSAKQQVHNHLFNNPFSPRIKSNRTTTISYDADLYTPIQPMITIKGISTIYLNKKKLAGSLQLVVKSPYEWVICETSGSANTYTISRNSRINVNFSTHRIVSFSATDDNTIEINLYSTSEPSLHEFINFYKGQFSGELVVTGLEHEKRRDSNVNKQISNNLSPTRIDKTIHTLSTSSNPVYMHNSTPTAIRTNLRNKRRKKLFPLASPGLSISDYNTSFEKVMEPAASQKTRLYNSNNMGQGSSTMLLEKSPRIDEPSSINLNNSVTSTEDEDDDSEPFITKVQESDAQTFDKINVSAFWGKLTPTSDSTLSSSISSITPFHSLQKQKQPPVLKPSKKPEFIFAIPGEKIDTIKKPKPQPSASISHIPDIPTHSQTNQFKKSLPSKQLSQNDTEVVHDISKETEEQDLFPSKQSIDSTNRGSESVQIKTPDSPTTQKATEEPVIDLGLKDSTDTEEEKLSEAELLNINNNQFTIAPPPRDLPYTTYEPEVSENTEKNEMEAEDSLTPQKNVTVSEEIKSRKSYSRTAIRKQNTERNLNWPSHFLMKFNDGKSMDISKHDMDCLYESQFLNDVIINFYLKYFLQNSPQETRDRTHLFNTFFFQQLTKKNEYGKVIGFDTVRKWTSKVNLFTKDFVIIPINKNMHWFVVIIYNLPALLNPEVVESEEDQSADSTDSPSTTINPENGLEASDKIRHLRSGSVAVNQSKKKKGGRLFNKETDSLIFIYDSLQTKLQYRDLCKNLREYIVAEANDKLKVTIDKARIISRSVPVPQQTNYSDCGIYLIHYIELFLKDPNRCVDLMVESNPQSDKSLDQYWTPELLIDKRTHLRNYLYKLATKDLPQEEKEPETNQADKNDEKPEPEPKTDLAKSNTSHKLSELVEKVSNDIKRTDQSVKKPTNDSESTSKPVEHHTDNSYSQRLKDSAQASFVRDEKRPIRKSFTLVNDSDIHPVNTQQTKIQQQRFEKHEEKPLVWRPNKTYIDPTSNSSSASSLNLSQLHIDLKPQKHVPESNHRKAIEVDEAVVDESETGESSDDQADIPDSVDLNSLPLAYRVKHRRLKPVKSVVNEVIYSDEDDDDIEIVDCHKRNDSDSENSPSPFKKDHDTQYSHSSHPQRRRLHR